MHVVSSNISNHVNIFITNISFEFDFNKRREDEIGYKMDKVQFFKDHQDPR